MTMYRITIEKEKDPPDGKYSNWEEIYQQIINDIEISKLINMINEPRPTQFAAGVVRKQNE